MKTLRLVLFWVLALAALLFAYVTMTVPMISATAPAILTIALVVGALFIYPRKKATP